MICALQNPSWKIGHLSPALHKGNKHNLLPFPSCSSSLFTAGHGVAVRTVGQAVVRVQCKSLGW